MSKVYIGSLMQLLLDKVKGAGITDTVYLEHGPTAVEDVPDTFCIITVPLTLRDRGPYQEHHIRFELVAKNMRSGRADILTIEDMANKLLGLFPIVDGRFSVTGPYIRLKGDDGLGHTSWVIQADVMIDLLDKYATDDGSTATT